jgi:hypothetical protein
VYLENYKRILYNVFETPFNEKSLYAEALQDFFFTFLALVITGMNMEH